MFVKDKKQKAFVGVREQAGNKQEQDVALPTRCVHEATRLNFVLATSNLGIYGAVCSIVLVILGVNLNYGFRIYLCSPK